MFRPRQRRYVIRPSVWGEGQFPVLLKRSQNQVPEGQRNDYNGMYYTRTVTVLLYVLQYTYCPHHFLKIHSMYNFY